MAKFQLLHDALLQRQLDPSNQRASPPAGPRRWLELVHSRDYHEAFSRHALHPLQQRHTTGGVLTARLALRHVIACHLAGGTHHAFPCLWEWILHFQNVAVAARVVAERGRGGAADGGRPRCTSRRRHRCDLQDNPRVLAFSAHCASNFPAKKQRSSLDLLLPDELEDEGYLKAIGAVVPDSLGQYRPSLVIYNAAGVDNHVVIDSVGCVPAAGGFCAGITWCWMHNCAEDYPWRL